MSEISSKYIFYADVYFMQNFIVKVIALYLSLHCNKLYFKTARWKGIGQILLAAFAGTMVEIIGFIFSNTYYIFVLCVNVFEVPLMVFSLLGKRYRNMISVIASGYFFTMLINSVLEILWNLSGMNESYIFNILVACGVVLVGWNFWSNYNRRQKGIFGVEICSQGKRINTWGLYDSGNYLKDPYTGMGVHIISEQIFKKLGLDNESAVLVPYQALGKEDGFVEVYYVEEFILEGEKQRKSWKKCPLGVTKDNLFKGRKYEIILNEEVF